MECPAAALASTDWMAVTSIPLFPLVKTQDIPDVFMCLLGNKISPEILRVQNVKMCRTQPEWKQALLFLRGPGWASLGQRYSTRILKGKKEFSGGHRIVLKVQTGRCPCDLALTKLIFPTILKNSRGHLPSPAGSLSMLLKTINAYMISGLLLHGNSFAA